MNRYARNGLPPAASGNGFGDGRTGGHGGPRRGGMIGAVTHAVQEDPLPAALIGLGAMWLFIGGNRMSLLGGGGRRSVIASAAHGTGAVAHAAGRLGSAAASSVGAAAAGAAGTLSETAGRVTDYVGGALHGPGAVEDGRDSGLSPALDVPALAQGMKELLRRHPVALGIAGLALGAGVAASLPVTDAERGTLGRAGEAVRSTLSGAAGEAREFAKAALNEAHRAAPRNRP